MSKQIGKQALSPEQSVVLETWVMKVIRLMTDFARRRMRDVDKAEDAIQDVLLKFMRRIEDGRMPVNALPDDGYVIASLKHQVIDNDRKHRREGRGASLDETQVDEEGNPMESPLLVMASEASHNKEMEKEKLREFNKMVAQQLAETLTERQHKVFILRWRGYNNTEIAELLHISEDRVKKDYDVARNKLKYHVRQKSCPSANQ